MSNNMSTNNKAFNCPQCEKEGLPVCCCVCAPEPKAVQSNVGFDHTPSVYQYMRKPIGYRLIDAIELKSNR